MADDADNAPLLRDLYFAVLECRSRLYETVLLPWTATVQSVTARLTRFRRLALTPSNDGDRLEGLWEFYALSRISDHLLLPFQATSPNDWRNRPAVDACEYVDFFEQLGFTSYEPTVGEPFSSFHHEIVEVKEAEHGSEAVTAVAVVWPGLRFGEMIFSRAGLRVRGGTNFVRKHVAESSTLYFTHRRLHRPTNDLSMGWGSNSQWRTAIRRDYEQGGRLYYNVDGRNPLSSASSGGRADRDGLTAEERIELCKNRCFVRTTKSHDDLWPYDDRYEEQQDRPGLD